MKKILNRPCDAIQEMTQGMALSQPGLTLNCKYHFFRKTRIDQDKVTLISGGGSGHEPAHAGYIGTGMLDAAVCGDVFASPSQIQIYQAIKATASRKGTLLIIKNYTGDILNFQNAAFLAGLDGLNVDYVKVCDDIAVEDSLYTVGRRGVAGTVLVHKIAGAAAQAGGSLEEVKRAAQKAADHVRSIGFALTSCTVPAKGTPTFTLEESQMEYGIGIHGEPGIRREPMATADELAEKMVDALVSELGAVPGTDTALLVNGFGGTPLMELNILAAAAANCLDCRGIKLYRVFTGNYMTSLEMQGASLSLMTLDNELKQLLDAESRAPFFRIDGPAEPSQLTGTEAVCRVGNGCYHVETPADGGVISGDALSWLNVVWLVDTMSQLIIENEQPFCQLDAYAGDGDFGMSVAKGFRRLKDEWPELLREKTIGGFLDACSMVIMENCGGASGPIWGFAFKYAAKCAGGTTSLSIQQFADMMQAAVRGVRETGERSFGRGAGVGDKTLMDALIPCADTWTQMAAGRSSYREAFFAAAKAAVDGAEATKQIVARMGRAGTVGERSLGYPDAGAYALGVIFTEIAQKVQEKKSE